MAIDILVIGATGYTGRLVTRYLIAHRERESFSLGLAARNTSKLTAFVDGLDITPSNSVPIFGVRDIQDKDALEKLFRDNGVRVVLSTVGPYQLYGRAIVEACAGTGVNYVDICGESTFVKDIIISFDYLAAKTGAILVPSGAFDSVPSDLLAYLSARTMGEELSKLLADCDGGDEDKKLEEVGVRDSHTMISFKGAGASGGTLNSMLTQISNFPRHVLLELERPDCLSPMEVVRTAPSRLVHTFPSFVTSRIPNLKNVVGYNLPLTPFNITIVQRTRGLFGLARYKRSTGDDDEYIKPAYAPDFLYTESFTASNRVSAFFLSVTFAVGLAALLYIPPLRWITRKLVTQPGDGPKDEALGRGYLHAENVSISSPLPITDKLVLVKSTMDGKGDPGYALTAVMVSECALGLLSPREKLPAIARRGGVLTPMVALGTILVKRLSASGRFEFESEVVGGDN